MPLCADMDFFTQLVNHSQFHTSASVTRQHTSMNPIRGSRTGLEASGVITHRPCLSGHLVFWRSRSPVAVAGWLGNGHRRHGHSVGSTRHKEITTSAASVILPLPACPPRHGALQRPNGFLSPKRGVDMDTTVEMRRGGDCACAGWGLGGCGGQNRRRSFLTGRSEIAEETQPFPLIQTLGCVEEKQKQLCFLPSASSRN